jgi:hypothetical protein
MKKKYFAIIICILLISTSFSITQASTDLEKNESDDHKGNYVMLKCIGLGGKGYSLKTFWNTDSNVPFIIIAHYDNLSYGFYITREGERTDFEGSCNVIIIGFSFGDLINSLGYDYYHEGSGNWYGFLEPYSHNLLIHVQYPFFVNIF